MRLIACVRSLVIPVAVATLVLPACGDDGAGPAASRAPAAQEVADRWSAAMADAEAISFEATQTREWLLRDGTVDGDSTQVYRFRGALDSANGSGTVIVHRTLFGSTRLMWRIRWDPDHIWASEAGGAWLQYPGDYWAESFAAPDIRDPAAWGLAPSQKWPGTIELGEAPADDTDAVQHLELALDPGALFDLMRPDDMDETQWQSYVDYARDDFVDGLRGQAGGWIDKTTGRLIRLTVALDDAVMDEPRTRTTTEVRVLAYDEPVSVTLPTRSTAYTGDDVPPLTYLMEVTDDLGSWGLGGLPW